MAAPITSTGFIQKKCWYEACDQKENATKRCARCRQAIYCGKECQRADWAVHKVTCEPKVKSSINPTQENFLSERVSSVDFSNIMLNRALNEPRFSQASLDPSQFGAKFEAFKQRCVEDSSPMALSEARKYAKLGQMREAADCISLMIPADQQKFLNEMAHIPEWRTVDIAIVLGLSKKMKEAMEIMEDFPPGPDRDRFLAGVRSVIGNYPSRYQKTTFF